MIKQALRERCTLDSGDQAKKSLYPIATKTLLISRNHVLLVGLQAALSHVTTIAMAHGGSHCSDVIQHVQPQVIILDMELHENVPGLIRQLKDMTPHTKILLLIGWNEMGSGWRASMEEVHGVVLKMQPPEVLLAAVTSLIRSPMGSDPLAANGCSAPEPHISSWQASLTSRERNILQLVSQGLSNKEIADHESISTITVRHHLTRIFEKLGISGRQKLTIHAHQKATNQHRYCLRNAADLVH